MIKIIVIERFFIFFNNFTLFNIVDKLFLKEKKQSDRIILYNSGIENREIKAHTQIVISNRSILLIYTFVYFLHT